MKIGTRISAIAADTGVALRVAGGIALAVSARLNRLVATVAMEACRFDVPKTIGATKRLGDTNSAPKAENFHEV